MNLTIHRGTNQIGGSCIELATESTRILLDIGLPLDFDKQSHDQQQTIVEQAKSWCDGIDAIFISHYHQEHHGLLSVAPLNIPVYVTAGTERMFHINAVFMKLRMSHILNLCLVEPARKVASDISPDSTITPAVPVRVGDITITAFTVDHSAYDACAYLIESGGKRVLYSGDIRLHGAKGSLYKNLPQNVDYLILEGTNIEKAKTIATESAIRKELVNCFSEEESFLNFIWCSGQNIDRLTNIFAAARAAHKTLVVDVYIASVMEEIHKLNNKIPTPDSHGIRVLYTIPTDDQERANYYIHFGKNRVHPLEIRQNPGAFVLIVRPSMLRFLKQNLSVSNANVVTSIWKEYEKDEMAFFSWVDERGFKRKQIHTSGHADQLSLIKLAEFINPKQIIPIHTEKKEVFKRIFGDKMVVLEDNELLKV